MTRLPRPVRGSIIGGFVPKDQVPFMPPHASPDSNASPSDNVPDGSPEAGQAPANTRAASPDGAPSLDPDGDHQTEQTQADRPCFTLSKLLQLMVSCEQAYAQAKHTAEQYEREGNISA